MKKISVGKGKFALVDDEDYGWLTTWKWHLNPTGYAVRKVYIDGRKAGSYQVMMHRLIAGTPERMHTDHKNGDPLDNRKANLRVCTNYENMKNRKININNTSGYKGVHLHTTLKRWVAKIGVNGKRMHLGLFDTPEDAARAYNLAALEHHGTYARLNKIENLKEANPPTLGIEVNEEIQAEESLG